MRLKTWAKSQLIQSASLRDVSQNGTKNQTKDMFVILLGSVQLDRQRGSTGKSGGISSHCARARAIGSSVSQRWTCRSLVSRRVGTRSRRRSGRTSRTRRRSWSGSCWCARRRTGSAPSACCSTPGCAAPTRTPSTRRCTRLPTSSG